MLFLRLDGIQASHIHFQQPVLPVNSGNPAVVDAAGDVAEWLSIFKEAVLTVIHSETGICGKLKNKKIKCKITSVMFEKLKE